jgi:hypothetical protein
LNPVWQRNFLGYCHTGMRWVLVVCVVLAIGVFQTEASKLILAANPVHSILTQNYSYRVGSELLARRRFHFVVQLLEIIGL